MTIDHKYLNQMTALAQQLTQQLLTQDEPPGPGTVFALGLTARLIMEVSAKMSDATPDECKDMREAARDILLDGFNRADIMGVKVMRTDAPPPPESP